MGYFINQILLNVSIHYGNRTKTQLLLLDFFECVTNINVHKYKSPLLIENKKGLPLPTSLFIKQKPGIELISLYYSILVRCTIMRNNDVVSTVGHIVQVYLGNTFCANSRLVY